MHVIIERSKLHTTAGGNVGQYVTAIDAATGRTVGRFHAILLEDGRERYQSPYGSSYPAGTSFADAVTIAVKARIRWKQIPYSVRVRMLRAMATDQPRAVRRRTAAPRFRHIVKGRRW